MIRALGPPISRAVELPVNSMPFRVQPPPAVNRGLSRLTLDQIVSASFAEDSPRQLRGLHVGHAAPVRHGAPRRAIAAKEVRRWGHAIGDGERLLPAATSTRQPNYNATAVLFHTGSGQPIPTWNRLSLHRVGYCSVFSRGDQAAASVAVSVSAISSSISNSSACSNRYSSTSSLSGSKVHSPRQSELGQQSNP
jgi:hypothetical protein